MGDSGCRAPIILGDKLKASKLSVGQAYDMLYLQDAKALTIQEC